MSFKVNGELIPAGGGDNIPLIRERMSVGRRDTCDICLRFPNVSGVHAELYFRAGYWYIKDCNSTNGVKVNGNRVIEKLLHPRDRVTIGKRDYVIKYEAPANQMSQLEEEQEEDVLSMSLLERAGLTKLGNRLRED
jgi:adenylate cyclase